MLTGQVGSRSFPPIGWQLGGARRAWGPAGACIPQREKGALEVFKQTAVWESGAVVTYCAADIVEMAGVKGRPPETWSPFLDTGGTLLVVEPPQLSYAFQGSRRAAPRDAEHSASSGSFSYPLSRQTLVGGRWRRLGDEVWVGVASNVRSVY